MNSLETLLSLIHRPEVIRFMQDYATEAIPTLSLKYASNLGFELAPVARQMALRQKAVTKISSFLKPETLLLPKLYEQSTHEAVAAFKMQLIKGQKLLDATTGLGIDTFFIGRNFQSITCLEANSEHAELLKHNYGLHGIDAEILNTTLETFLETTNTHFDVIYIDPDRRPDAGKRLFEIEECTPNVVQLKQPLLQRADEVWIKLSPMMDIHALVTQFAPNINKLYCIAFHNELKEILICMKAGTQQLNFIGVNITSESVSIYEAEDTLVKPPLASAATYFFEPNVALIKSRLAMPYAMQNELHVLYPGGFYFTTNTCLKHAQGRFFEIANVTPFKQELLKQFIKTNKITKANISCRNFYWKPEEVKKQLKLYDGGEWYLFCYNDGEKKPVAVWCRRKQEEKD